MGNFRGLSKAARHLSLRAFLCGSGIFAAPGRYFNEITSIGKWKRNPPAKAADSFSTQEYFVFISDGLFRYYKRACS